MPAQSLSLLSCEPRGNVTRDFGSCGPDPGSRGRPGGGRPRSCGRGSTRTPVERAGGWGL
eukprot:2555680-Alexandrium_andersonii.AAC.1